MTPYVSLALFVYNGEKFIAEAIRSILDQDFRDFELIITDNTSTDGTEAICRQFAASDSRINYVHNERNLGAGPNQNKGFGLSSGKYFKWCACDDRLGPGYLSRCVAVLDANPDAVLAFGRTETIDQDGHALPLIGSMLSSLEGLGPARRFQQVIAEQFDNYEIFGLFRRDALAKSLLHRPYYGSDHTLLCEMALLGRFFLVPDVVFYNRDHADRSVKVNTPLDSRKRTEWQCTDAKRRHSLEHISHFLQLFEVAVRHRGEVSPVETIPIVLRSELRPRRLAQHFLDVLEIPFPTSRQWMRKTGWSILHKLKLDFQ